jgi:hypothetical protein
LSFIPTHCPEREVPGSLCAAAENDLQTIFKYKGQEIRKEIPKGAIRILEVVAG